MTKKHESAGEGFDFTRAETLQHIMQVRDNLNVFIQALLERGNVHDASKFSEDEMQAFITNTPILRDMEYGSPGYKEALKGLGPALQHHYANNSHHPEYYKDGIEGMDLLDIVEMFADWAAATKRYKDSTMEDSIAKNQKRFKMSSQLTHIFLNTISVFEDADVIDKKERK